MKLARIVAVTAAVVAGGAAACSAPSRSGPAANTVRVGTATYTLEDASRRDPVDAARSRAWIVQLYYPSVPTAVTGVYADDPEIVAAMIAGQYYGASEAELRGWTRRPAVAVDHAAPATTAPLPLVTLSPGLGFARLNYAELAAHLVTRGYVVAVIDHPYIGLSRLGGRMVRSDDDPALQSDDPADSLPRVREWTRDIAMTIRDVEATVRVDGLHVDPARVVAAGHSIGGTAAVGACTPIIDALLAGSPVRACMDFEGFLEGSDALTTGATHPVLAVFSRAKGRPRVGKPGEADPMDAIARQLAAGGQPIWRVKVTGGSHTSFSDAPDVLPRTLSRFGGELMTPARSFELYTGMVDAFARGPADFAAFLRTAPEAAATRD